MKTSLILSILLVFCSSAFAKTFSFTHEVAFMNYGEAKACLADGYKWQDGYCIAEGVDSVTLNKVGENIEVTVETITTNAHSCMYEAKNGKFVSPTKIVSSLPSTVYDENGKETPALCAVTVTHHEDQSVSVTSNGYEQCSEFCGVNGSLDIESAKSN